MLPEMFCSAKDCACNPPTEVFSASKIPITLSPTLIRRPSQSAAIRGQLSQALCQVGKSRQIRRLNENAPVEGPGHNCRAGNSCRARSARLRPRRMEDQRKTVHAIAQAGRLRAVVEDVAEVAAAAAAMHFGAGHAEGAVLGGADRILQRLVEARPASAALELGVGGEQRQVAAGAGENALAMLLQERARAGALGTLLAQDLVLLRRQLRAP